MSLLVSKRLGIGVAPDLELLNISPEPKLLPMSHRRPISRGGGGSHHQKRVKDTTTPPPPPLLLPHRKRQPRELALEESDVTEMRSSDVTGEEKGGAARPVAEETNHGDRSKKRIWTPLKRQNSRLELLKAKLAEASLEPGRKPGTQSGKVSGGGVTSGKVSAIQWSSCGQQQLQTPDQECLNEEDGEEENSFPKDPAYRADKRQLKRRRSPSIELRSATKNVRNVVDVISGSFHKKREEKMNRMMGMNDQQVHEANKEKATRKISMQWLSRTINAKRMSYLNGQSPDPTDLSPFQKFRRAARKVKSLIQVCHACRSIVLDQVSNEDWFAKIEAFIDSTDELLSKPQGPSHMRPFITFVPDKETKQLVQLTFDKSIFTRERRADYLLTNDIRTLLKTPPEHRSQDDENEVLMFLKRASPSFNEYTLEAQRKLLKCMHYDKYEKDRVITRKNLMADGVYFVLSGTLVEKIDDKKSLREMKPGERFGDEDIVCGCPRRTTVVTHSDVELLTIHRLDYRMIVHMADDSNDPKYLEICREDIVFRHFPVRKLIENPGVWTLLSYKYGRLMVKDSNDMEWIYIIKSGEAKVMKQLKAGTIDLAQRRKKIRHKMEEDDPHSFQRKMIDFVSERDYLTSKYKASNYNPRDVQSAPSGAKVRTQRQSSNPLPSLPNTPFLSMVPKSRASSQMSLDDHGNQFTSPASGKQETSTYNKTNASAENMVNKPGEMIIPGIEVNYVEADTDKRPRSVNGEEYNLDLSRRGTESSPRREGQHITIIDTKELRKSPDQKAAGMFIDTSKVKDTTKLPQLSHRGSRTSLYSDDKKQLVNVPPFVQLESLHAGKVFGLRSCLSPEERGPSASLISGGCEVLQINKKFFMKHTDDAIMSLIKVQYKPFPSEDSLIDRLDNNFQWEVYKQNTMIDLLVKKGRVKEDELKVTIDLTPT